MRHAHRLAVSAVECALAFAKLQKAFQIMQIRINSPQQLKSEAAPGLEPSAAVLFELLD